MKLVGLLARNPQTSLGPAVMEAFFAKKELGFHYQAFEVDPPQFREAFEGLRVLSGVGFNVGAPYRGIAVRHVTKLSREVGFVGSLDTVVMARGVDTGYNVQTGALVQFLGEIGFSPQGQSALVIGAGSAASVGVYVLLEAGAEKVFIANKTLERAESLAERYDPYFQGKAMPIFLSEEETGRVLPRCSLILHATPLGGVAIPQMWPAVHYGEIRPDAVVVDMVYRPQNTPFLARAARFASRTHSGLRIFALSLARSWKLWSGKENTKEIWEVAQEVAEPPGATP